MNNKDGNNKRTTQKPSAPKSRKKKATPKTGAATHTESHNQVVEVEYYLQIERDGCAMGHECHKLTNHEFKALDGFLTILRQDHGWTTPVDEFVAGLWKHASEPMTPANIQAELNICITNLENIAGDAKLLYRQYPKLFLSDDDKALLKKLNYLVDTSKLDAGGSVGNPEGV